MTSFMGTPVANKNLIKNPYLTLISDDVIYHEAIEKKLTRTCEKHEFDRSFWKLTIIQV